MQPLLAFWPPGNPLMLLWGLSAAIPIIIHLWNRRKYQEMRWAAMEFLLAALKKNSRRIQIEQLLLLAVRTLILLLLAVALSDPLLSLFAGLGGKFRAGQTHHVLVLDGSYSMAYRRGERTRFEAARDAAIKMVEESPQGDGFTLVLMTDVPRAVIAEPAFDPSDVIEELKNQSVAHGGASLSGTWPLIAGLLEKGTEQHSRLANARVIFFTDLGQTTWDEVTRDDARERAARLGERATLVMVDVGQSDAQNLALTQLTARDSLATVARPGAYEAEVENFGSQPATVTVQFLADDVKVQESRLEIAPGDRVVAGCSHRWETPGDHRLEARLESDSLDIDNHRWLSVPVRESVRVLCIAGRESAAKYLSLALEPAKSERPLVRTDVKPDGSLLETDLSQYDAIFLANVDRFRRDEANVLHDFVRQGGGLVTFLGDLVQIENYNQELAGLASERRVLPATLGDVSADAQYAFDPLDYRHRIVQPFRGEERAGLLVMPIWRYIRLTPLANETAPPKVALAFTNGDPAIIEQSIGRGRSILFASAVDDSQSQWTAFSAWHSFLPLVQEMLWLAVGGRADQRNLLLGEPLEGSIHSTIANLPLSVVGPDGQADRVKVTVDGDDSRWVYEGASQSGIYEAKYGAPLSLTHVYATNVRTRESNLDRFDAELLPGQFQQQAKADDGAKGSLPTTRRFPFFRWLLGTVLALVLVETFLAWYFGNRSA